MKLIEYLLMESEQSPKDGHKEQKTSSKKDHPHASAKKLANRKVLESSSQVSQLIKGRHSIDMKAFKGAREKDPASVVGALGVKGGAGWDGILNVVNSLAGSKGLGQVISGAQLINNGGNVEDEDGDKLTMGCLVSVTGMWAQGHKDANVSKKLVAWWVKQVLQGAFQSGLVGPEPKMKKYNSVSWKKWSNSWKIYEGNGGMIIFYGRATAWNGPEE